MTDTITNYQPIADCSICNGSGLYCVGHSGVLGNAPILERCECYLDNIQAPDTITNKTIETFLDELEDDLANPAYGIVDPDYARVYSIARCTAWMYGYSVLMHGSFTRDLDLLIVPWDEKIQTDPQHIIDMICSRCELEENGVPPSIKPHGRLVYTLHFKTFGDPRFIDVGFMPAIKD